MAEYKLSKEGEEYLRKGLPEKNLVLFLDSLPQKSATMGKVMSNVKNFSIALKWALEKGWISKKGDQLILLKPPYETEEEVSIKKIAEGKDADEKIIKILFERNLLVRITEVFKKTKEEIKAAGNIIQELTHDLIITNLWKGKKFKPIQVESVSKTIHEEKMNGVENIINGFIGKVRRIFLELGFTEAQGPFVESNFWNFDALFQPQDHPARELAATFYSKNKINARLPDKKFVNAVKKTHENGYNTGSTGWQYKWSGEFAKQTVLRTHTTAVSARMLAQIKPPAKIFCIGRVFRNETIDYKHLPEFTQIEGIVADKSVGFKELLGYLKEFYLRLGFTKVRFRPAYFPYTEMSAEPEVYFEERNEWMELGGSGIFRPEVTKPLGIDVPVLAWGLSLERPVMLKLALNDIRNFYYKNDLKVLKELKPWL